MSKRKISPSTQEILQEIYEGKSLKNDIYFRQVQVTLEIMGKSTASDINRLKAIQLQQQALNEIPDDIYNELTEVYS